MFSPVLKDNNINFFNEKFSSLLLKKFGETIFNSWLTHIKFYELKESILSFTVPSRFIREWVQNNYYSDIFKIAREYDSKIEKIDFKIKSDESVGFSINTNDIKIVANEIIPSPKCEVTSSTLDPRYTFDNFIVGSANKVAYSSAKAIAAGNDLIGANNILYLQAPVGMGKTHLIQSIASYSKEHHPQRKVVYLSAEKFMHLYIKAVKNNLLIDFKEKLRTADIFLLDDLQFICGKTGTLQEFINTFNALTEANKKVVLAADCSPYALNLDQRSVSRLSGGLVADIKTSDYELRKEILLSKAKIYNISIPTEVIELLAQKIVSTNRELEGALNKLIAYSTLEEREINIETALEILKDNIDAHTSLITIEDILEKVADFYKVNISDICSKSRGAKIVRPRQVVAYLAKRLTTKSLQDIGFKLGKRDHATIIYSIKKLENDLKENQILADEINNLIGLLNKKI